MGVVCLRAAVRASNKRTVHKRCEGIKCRSKKSGDAHVRAMVLTEKGNGA